MQHILSNGNGQVIDDGTPILQDRELWKFGRELFLNSNIENKKCIYLIDDTKSTIRFDYANIYKDVTIYTSDGKQYYSGVNGTAVTTHTWDSTLDISIPNMIGKYRWVILSKPTNMMEISFLRFPCIYFGYKDVELDRFRLLSLDDMVSEFSSNYALECVENLGNSSTTPYCKFFNVIWGEMIEYKSGWSEAKGLVKLEFPDGATSDSQETGFCENMFNSLVVLEKIHIPNTFLNLPNYCFSQCTSLYDVNIENIINFGEYCLSKTKIRNVNFNVNTFNIFRSFSGCPFIREVIFPSKVNTAYYAFENCPNLTKATLEDGITGVGFTGTFYNCPNLNEVYLSKTMTAIGSQMFRLCPKLKSIYIYKEVQYIYTDAFAQCYDLQEVLFEEGSKLIRIEQNAFIEDRSLYKIDLPDGITTLANGCFTGSGLRYFKVPTGVITIDNIFNNIAFAFTTLEIVNPMLKFTSNILRLVYGRYIVLPKDFKIQSAILTIQSMTELSIDSVLDIADKLIDNTGNTVITIKIPYNSYQILTAPQKLLFTNKNYTISA